MTDIQHDEDSDGIDDVADAPPPVSARDHNGHIPDDPDGPKSGDYLDPQMQERFEALPDTMTLAEFIRTMMYHGETEAEVTEIITTATHWSFHPTEAGDTRDAFIFTIDDDKITVTEAVRVKEVWRAVVNDAVTVLMQVRTQDPLQTILDAVLNHR